MLGLDDSVSDGAQQLGRDRLACMGEHGAWQDSTCDPKDSTCDPKDSTSHPDVRRRSAHSPQFAHPLRSSSCSSDDTRYSHEAAAASTCAQGVWEVDPNLPADAPTEACATAGSLSAAGAANATVQDASAAAAEDPAPGDASATGGGAAEAKGAVAVGVMSVASDWKVRVPASVLRCAGERAAGQSHGTVQGAQKQSVDEAAVRDDGRFVSLPIQDMSKDMSLVDEPGAPPARLVGFLRFFDADEADVVWLARVPLTDAFGKLGADLSCQDKRGHFWPGQVEPAPATLVDTVCWHSGHRIHLYLSICLSVCLSVCLYVFLYRYRYRYRYRDRDRDIAYIHRHRHRRVHLHIQIDVVSQP